MFKLSHYFNVKRDLAGAEAATGADAPAATDTNTQASAATTEQPGSLLGGNQQQAQAQTDKPDPFISELPKPEDKDGWASLYAKLGRPESAEGYELQVPDGDSGEFAKQSSAWMHEAGLNKQQAQALAAKWNEHQAQQNQSIVAQRDKQMTDDKAAVKQEWGAKYDANLATVQKAVNQFAPPEFIDILDKSGLINNPIITNMFLKIGSAISEDQLVSTQKGAVQGGEQSIANRLWPDMK